MPPAWRDAAWATATHPLVQRLRRVRQCGALGPLRGVNRYDHSIGTGYLAILAGRALDCSDTHIALLGLAGLLHDTGHGPGSHAFDRALAQNGARPHEHRSVFLAKAILDTVRAHFPPHEPGPSIEGNLAVSWVCHMIAPALVPCPDYRYAVIGTVISNSHHHVDVDKLDYIRRDATAAGVTGAVPYDPEAMLADVHAVTDPCTGEYTMVFASRHAASVAVVSHGRQMLHDAVYNCPLASRAHDALQALLRLVDRMRAAHECVPDGSCTEALSGVTMSITHAAAYPGWWIGFDDRFVERLAQHSEHPAIRRAATEAQVAERAAADAPRTAWPAESQHPASCNSAFAVHGFAVHPLRASVRSQ